jgi:hypothetical protein
MKSRVLLKLDLVEKLAHNSLTLVWKKVENKVISCSRRLKTQIMRVKKQLIDLLLIKKVRLRFKLKDGKVTNQV